MKQVILIAAYYVNQNKCLTLNSINIMKPTITVNQYTIGWEWLDISSEREYMNQYTDIRILTNELEPC